MRITDLGVLLFNCIGLTLYMQSSSSVYGNFNDHIFVDSSFYHYEIFLSLLIHSISWLHRWFQILILYCMWGLEIWLLPLCRCGGLSHHGFSKWQSLHGSNGFKYGSCYVFPLCLWQLDTLLTCSGIEDSVSIPLSTYQSFCFIYSYIQEEELHIFTCDTYRKRRGMHTRRGVLICVYSALLTLKST